MHIYAYIRDMDVEEDEKFTNNMMNRVIDVEHIKP